jgi:hypothetical protein
MPLTALGGPTGTFIIGNTTTAFPETLHPDVMTFIAAQASVGYVMTRNEINALNNMVLGLVANGIWTKLQALYPFIGSTAASQKFNLKDSRDADAAYRLSFLGGGWTHSANGATPNGTTSYADTFLNANSVLTLSSNHLSYYSRTASNISVVYDCGSSANAGSAINMFSLFMRRTLDNTSAFDSGNSTPSRVSTNTIPVSSGFFIGSKTSNSDRRLFYNGVLRATNTASDTNTLSTRTVYIGAINNNGTAAFFGNRQCAFFSIGDGLTSAEAFAYYQIVQSFQTTLGRQV